MEKKGDEGMLHLLLGEDWIQNRDEILDLVAHRVENRQTGTVLLVPEHISHEAEVDLCRALGPTASRDAEVLSFRSSRPGCWRKPAAWRSLPWTTGGSC